MTKRNKTGSTQPAPKLSRVTFGFSFPDNALDFKVVVNPQPTYSRVTPPEEVPEWALLKTNRCTRCTLRADCKYCPAALKFSDVVTRVTNRSASDKVILTKQTGAEVHQITTDLQHALSFVFPVVVARSACPHAHLLHVVDMFSKPFPRLLDLTFYTVAFELVGRWVNAGLGRPSSIDSMAARINDLEAVFHGLMNRLRNASLGDATLNGIMIDLQWSYVPLYSRELWLQMIGSMFLEDTPASSATQMSCGTEASVA